MKKKIENPLFVPAPEPTDFCTSLVFDMLCFFDHLRPGPIAAATFTRPLIGGIWIKGGQLLPLGNRTFLQTLQWGQRKTIPEKFSFKSKEKINGIIRLDNLSVWQRSLSKHVEFIRFFQAFFFSKSWRRLLMTIHNGQSVFVQRFASRALYPEH